MIARITTVAFRGIDALSVDVQVQMTSGLPAFIIVGLPDKAIAESRERVRAALKAFGLSLPPKRIVVNLSPADLQKEGSHYDLPIALGLLSAMNVLGADQLEDTVAVGELALDGRLTAVSGVLPAAVHALAQNKRFICPAPCGGEAAWAGDLDVLAPATLIALINHFKGTQVLRRPEPLLSSVSTSTLDLAEIRGQETAKRALEIAAAGGHNLLLIGPPGAGKSMLAARLATLLPPLEPREALEVSMIHSIAGQLAEGRLLRTRPFRDPHHSASLPALIGGGVRATPGEVSLAHRGVLFLDELPEFQRAALEALRQPLETGSVTVSRANVHITYPARFQMIAAMNPCRCGYLDDAERACSRVPRCGNDYQAKISGPLLDRIDLSIAVPEVRPATLQSLPTGDPSAIVAQRVLKARHRQKERFSHQGFPDQILTNADLSGKMLEAVCPLKAEGEQFLLTAAEKFKLSARSYHRVLKVARTIADLEGSPDIEKPHLAEALHFRQVS
jgi:magnesium chelatase family protein